MSEPPTPEQIEAFRRDLAAVYLKHGLVISKEPCCSYDCMGGCHLNIDRLREVGVLDELPSKYAF